MPCMTYSPQEESANAHREIVRLNKLLCLACTIIDGADLTGKMKSGLKSWWDDHQEEDRRRKARARKEREAEELRQQAINKLDSAERAALGIREPRKTKKRRTS